MPIRMVKDPGGNKPKRKIRTRNKSNFKGGGGSGIGGLVGGLLPSLLPMLMKKPKLLIIAAIGIGAYMFFGKGCSSSNSGGGIADIVNQFSTGGNFDKEVYESTEIYEPLADNVKNPLPEKVSLLQYAPKRLNQGQQGSCVAWASAYAARTILEAQRTGRDPNSVKFSPSFMYNQISLDKRTCQGSYIKLAMDNMMGIGAVPFNDFKYDDRTCSTEPSQQLKAKAQAYKIKGFQRLTEEDNTYAAREMLSMKQNLAKGSPVIIGMMVGGSFMRDMAGREVWIPTNADYDQRGFGGHAMCVIGYDDYKEGGAFQIMNSWGTDWGVDGVGWVRYTDFKAFNIESYGLYPMGNADNKAVSEFKGSFGLELNNGKKTIALQRKNDFYFETVSKVNPTDLFKVEFTNNMECYTYIFAQELNMTSTVLFPYTPKHSPYMGITGTRLFPRDYSMQSDGKGGVDKIAVVITKRPIDFNALNDRISNASGSSFEEKVRNVLSGELESNIRYSGSNIINFSTSTSKDKSVAFVIGVKK